MDEAEFNRLADGMLSRIEGALEGIDAGFDFELGPGGVIEIDFEDGSKIVINRHTAAREIWVAARSGGFHFRPQSGKWIGTRDGQELMACLARLVSEQCGQAVMLA